MASIAKLQIFNVLPDQLLFCVLSLIVVHLACQLAVFQGVSSEVESFARKKVTVRYLHSQLMNRVSDQIMGSN